MRFVETFARNFGLRGDEDMLAAGFAAIWKAVQTYDPTIGSFKTYSSWWIKYYMREEKKRRATVFVTRHGMEKGVSIEVMPLDVPDTVGGVPLSDTLPCEDESADLVLEAAEDKERVRRALGTLKPREQAIIKARMEGKTLQEVGDTLGLTRERVRQIEAAAMPLMRQRLEEMA